MLTPYLSMSSGSGYIKKVAIVGTTGSGKTTFLKNLVVDFDGSKTEAPRNVSLEEEQILNTFTAVGREMYVNSTTTISMNASGVLFITTRTNQFHYFPLEQSDLPIELIDMDNLYPTMLIDTAGQERFNFMQDIGIKGANGVIIFADGTNVQSIERIANFYDKIKAEEERQGREIPIIVFINKKDLEDKGLYIGKSAIARWIPDLDIDTFETSNLDIETFFIPLRNFLNRIEGFPISPDQVKLRNATT